MAFPNLRCQDVRKTTLFDPFGHIETNRKDLGIKNLLVTDTAVIGNGVTTPAAYIGEISAMNGNLNIAVCNNMAIDAGELDIFSNGDIFITANGNVVISTPNLNLCDTDVQVQTLRACPNSNNTITINAGLSVTNNLRSNNLVVNNNITSNNLTVNNNLTVGNNITGNNLVINNNITSNNLTVNNNITANNITTNTIVISGNTPSSFVNLDVSDTLNVNNGIFSNLTVTNTATFNTVTANSYNLTISNVGGNVNGDTGFVFQSNTGPLYNLRTIKGGLNTHVSSNVSNIIVDATEFNWRSAKDVDLIVPGDDTATVQACVDAVAALGGGMVVLPAKTGGAPYVFTGTVTIPAAPGRIVIRGAHRPILQWSAGTFPLFDITGCNGVEFENLRFIPATGFFPSEFAIVGENVVTLSIHDCLFSVVGVSCTGGDIRIYDNRFNISETPAVQCNSGSGSALSVSSIHHNTFSSWGIPNSSLAFSGFRVISLDSWAALTPYIVGDLVITGGLFYICAVPGTSSAVAPTTKSNAVVDGSVTWVYLQRNPIAAVEVQGPIGINFSDTFANNNFQSLYRAIRVDTTNAVIQANNFRNVIQCIEMPFRLGDPLLNQGFANFSVLGNTFFNYTVGVAIFASPLALSPVEYGSIVISGNTFTDGFGNLVIARAVNISLSELFGGAPINVTLRSLSINGNTFKDSNGDSVIRIRFGNAVDPAPEQPTNIRSLVICHNNVDCPDAGNAISIQEVNAIQTGDQRIVVCDNQVFYVNTPGPAPTNGITSNIPAVADKVIYARNAYV